MSLAVQRGLCALLFAIVATSCATSSPLVFDTPAPGALGDNTQAGVLGTSRSTADDATTSDLASDELTAGELSTDAEATDSSGVTPDRATQASVEAVFTRLMSGWVDCFHRPARCDVTRLTASKSPERQRLSESLSFYTTEKIRTKPDEGRLQWSIESLSLPSNDRARLLTCEYDTRIFFDSSMADTEFGDIIFDTTVWTRRVEWTLARDGDSWGLWSRRIERRSPVARFCTP
jgi:hypothetical protein